MCSFLSVDEPESILAKELSRVDSGFIRYNYNFMGFIPQASPAKLLATLTTFAFGCQRFINTVLWLLTVCIPGAAAVGDCAQAALPAWGGRPDKFEGFHQGAGGARSDCRKK